MDNSKLCPKFEIAFSLLGKKWTGLILKVLMNGPKRFSDIKLVIPELSDKMLTERFKELELNGIVKRNVYAETPVRIEYELTEKGNDLEKVMDSIQNWASKWID
ncbi:winged helix-turn-helix transcriptional regulator [Clostridium frigidicarnis]|uniref:DNA-binding transcriptional regulator, HxlR family n=1 Tax=Clostridium frigidicarnis TaxID=84698 RepID=A0A1I1AGH4_9CLOT|nr:helix-turn-helix domain-containing protein [Clostridium frigidicarnis]SFB35600.1 DNA-binding transcriptional regulator, HxlR family [Clostridium frigidicarnis]